MGKVSLSIQLERAATTATTVICRGYVVLIATVRIGDNIRGNRASLSIKTESANEFRCLCFLICGDESVLCALRSRETECLILVAESLNLLVAHIVDDSVTKLVDSLEGVAVVCLSIKSALQIHLFYITATIGNLLGEIPTCAFDSGINILDRAASITATLCKLCGKSVHARLVLITEGADCVVDSAEVVVEGVIECGKAVSESVSLLINLADESLLIDSRADICLSSARGTATSAAVTAGITAEAVAKATTAPTKEEKDDDPNLLS